tara:strand:+ start:1199 stop:1834 length:636 start_codon:yes stop_codon:yes gene_type:complete
MIDNRNTEEFLRNVNSTFRRSNIVNHLITTNSFTKYLEIGIFDGFTFKQVSCDLKHGVEPGAEGVSISEVTHKMTSDDFFDICDESYDVILIDGLHVADQVVKDFNNSLKHISEGGYILFHDCNPADKISQEVPRNSVSWNGDVWKAFLLVKEANPHALVYDTDFGIGLLKNDRPLKPVSKKSIDMSWEVFSQNKVDLLTLTELEDLKDIG